MTPYWPQTDCRPSIDTVDLYDVLELYAGLSINADLGRGSLNNALHGSNKNRTPIGTLNGPLLASNNRTEHGGDLGFSSWLGHGSADYDGGYLWESFKRFLGDSTFPPIRCRYTVEEMPAC